MILDGYNTYDSINNTKINLRQLLIIFSFLYGTIVHNAFRKIKSALPFEILLWIYGCS